MSLSTQLFNIGVVVGGVLLFYFGSDYIHSKSEQKHLKLRTQLIASIVEGIETTIKNNITEDETEISNIVSKAIELLNKANIPKLKQYKESFTFGYQNNKFIIYHWS